MNLSRTCLHHFFYPFVFVLIAACSSPSENEQEDTEVKNPLFTLISADQSGVTFENTLTEGLNTNILMYEYFYNGGGIAIGDLNGDGLDDIYFTGNMVDNKLYLNKGNLEFKDVTSTAGVTGRPGPWATGTTMADVNGDGLLDIYVCYSGSLPPEKRKNQLFINLGPDANGIPLFEEQASAYGVDSDATTTQAVFFDMDNDGDLDLFLLNHNPKSLPILDESNTAAILKQADSSGPQLFENVGGKFVDVTSKAGIFSSPLSYGLGAGVSDINGDGYLDIYVCNDYTVPDYLYINNGNGTFTDKLGEHFGHISNFSMGNDIADINNDGLVDLITLDMLPEDNRRQKLLMAPDNYEKFEFNLRVGFHHQYMRNMLQLNNGNGTFSEIGQLAGVSNTDWSWAALFADYDNDGWKDLFVTNGYHRDYTNMDFLKYMADFIKKYQGLKRENVLELVNSMPSSNVMNYMFQNNANKTFKNTTKGWGLAHLANSNGAAYADLDNDGDLDLVINNVSSPAFLYRNNAETLLNNNFLKVELRGEKGNSFGIGAKLTAYYQGQQQFLEQMPTRGFQSSVSPTLHFGLGDISSIDSLEVQWLGNKSQTLHALEANQTITLYEKDAARRTKQKPRPATILKPTTSPINNTQTRNQINDFKRQPLLINPLSFDGPVLAKADINGDGLEDVFVGAEAGTPPTLYLQNPRGIFRKSSQPALESDLDHQDTYALFLDVDGDGDLDLYVASGGYGEFLPTDKRLQDRIYLNDGNGNLVRSNSSLPQMYTATSVVAAQDITGDGLPDLFVGSRVIPGRYPEIPESYILINQGGGKYEIQTEVWNADLSQVGLVTDAAWADLDGDGTSELIVVGEWMPIKIFEIGINQLNEVSDQYFTNVEANSGWWNTLWLGDLNGDGKPDFLLGNQGLNTQVRASVEEPAELHYKDFDGNGSVEPILSFYIQGKSYPYVTRDELLDQISIMRTRFTNYAVFAEATLEDIFKPEELANSGYAKANRLETTMYLSQPNGQYMLGLLPLEAQYSPVFAIYVEDLDGDGHDDILMCGNIDRARLRFGKYDANYGMLFTGNGKGKFEYVSQVHSGLNLRGDVRSILSVNNHLLFGINQTGIVSYEKNR